MIKNKNLKYFYEKKDEKVDYFKLKRDVSIYNRKNRNLIKKTSFKFFFVGDILEFVYFYKNIPLLFSGICISIKRKNFFLSDVIIIVRNIIFKIGIEITISYFLNRIYKLKFLDFKRKFFNFNKNKLYFIRKRINRESKIN